MAVTVALMLQQTNGAKAQVANPSERGRQLRTRNDSDIRYDWKSPSRCADLRKIERWVSKNIPNQEGAKSMLSVKGNVYAVDGRNWAMDLELMTESGSIRRKVQSSKCDELIEFTGLMIALVLGPDGPKAIKENLEVSDDVSNLKKTEELTNLSKKQDNVVVGDSTIGNDKSATKQSNENTSPSRRRIQWGVGLLGGIAWGALPVPSGVVGASIRGQIRRWQIDLAGSWLPTQRVEYLGGNRASYTMGWSRFRTGRRFQFSRWILLPAVGVEAGAIQGRGLDLDINQQSSLPWLAIPASFEVEFRLSRLLSFNFAVESAFAVIRPKFVLDFVQVHRSRVFDLRGFAQVFFSIP